MILLLSGCISYEDGQAERGLLNCELAETCDYLGDWGFADVQECSDVNASQTWNEANCPDYDGGAMRDCLDAYELAIETHDCNADLTTVCDVCRD